MMTFVTTTAYGSWLPGDARGWVRDGQILPANPSYEQHAKKIMNDPAVHFSPDDRIRLLKSMRAACDEFGYGLRDLAIESWHLHWNVVHQDQIAQMIGRLKNRMRQALGRGRIWTEGYCASLLMTEHDIDMARSYIRRHPGCMISAGVMLAQSSVIAIEPPAEPGADGGDRA
jgi:hypothetical protein